MQRRAFLTSAAAGAAVLSTPSIVRAQGSRVLKFVPQANLSSMDAVAGTQYVVRNAALMVWDTLYGVDSSITPRPQMCEGHEVNADFTTWTFKLRPGLKFHDGETVTTRDVIASLNRWMVRDTMGQRIKASLDALEALDDRTFRFRLNKPFAKMLFAIGKSNAPVAFIMPERIAKTDPFQLIKEYVGSGPMKFKTSEWVPGASAVFEKFEGYSVRDEAGDWIAGGKRVAFDRIEWVILPDAATAAAALQNGEVDWWENPITDLIPQLKRNRNIRVDIADPLGNIGTFRMNHLTTPFNNLKARQAVLAALSQEDYMRALVGDDNALWKKLGGYFTPGTPLYTEQGGDVLAKGPQMDLAKRLLAESGYNGSPVTCVVAQDQPITKAQGDVTADLLKRIGFNVDYVATDWGTTGQRRAMKNPVGQGGWSMFHSWHAGADCINPAVYIAIRANGDKAWFGWPDIPAVEGAVGEWFDAPNQAAEKAALGKLNAAAVENVLYVPTGFFLGYQAWRSNVSGIVKGPFPVPWGVAKA